MIWSQRSWKSDRMRAHNDFFPVDRDFRIITRQTVNINFLATCEFATAFSMPQLDPPMTDATRSGEVRAGDRRGAQWRGGRRQPAKKSCPHSVQGFLHRKLKLETVFTPCRGHRVTQPPPRACDVSVRCIIYDHQRNVQEVSPHPRKMGFVMGPVSRFFYL